MNQAEHPTIEMLSGYVRSPESPEFEQLRLHLASCAECRTRVGSISNMVNEITSVIPQYRGQSAETLELSGLEVENYVDGLLDDPDAQRVRTLLQENGPAMKAALHYATHSEAMRQHVSSLSERLPDTRQKTTQSFLKAQSPGFFNLLERVINWRPAVWVSVPVTAMVVMLVTVLLFPVAEHGRQADITIAVYQDNPVIVFRSHDQSAPGIGFFGTAQQDYQPFGAMSVMIENENRIKFNWPAVEGANSYELTLFVVDKAERNKVAGAKTSEPQIVLADLSLQPNRRYEWQLTGTTQDKKFFQTRGGFVVKTTSN
jgi:anti-sigma factor RsiW